MYMRYIYNECLKHASMMHIMKGPIDGPTDPV